MKKLLFIIPLIIISCGSDEDCTQRWEYIEYCVKKSNNCDCKTKDEVLALGQAGVKSTIFDCDEVRETTPGALKVVYNNDCYTTWRMYLNKK